MLASDTVTVLIADDDADAREVLGEVLTLMLPGVRTVFAVDGLDAVAVALAVCPWAAILDLGMPRMSGLDAAQSLQERMGKDLPILIAASATTSGCAKATTCSTTRCESRSRCIDSPATWRERWCFPTDRTDRGPRRPTEAGLRSRLLALDALLARRFGAQAFHAFRIRAPARLARSQRAPGPREQPGAVARVLCRRR